MKVSIIIPVYNIEQYLDKCLTSLVNQTYKNIEIILVDDGSKDNSGKICDELKEKDIRASERRFYQKITDIFKECSYDYDKNSEITKEFYKNIQNKLHYAITGMTAPEIIYNRVDAKKDNLGLQTGAIETYGTFNPLEYNAASIKTENEFPYFNVTLHDQVSGASDDVFFTPVICGEYAESILYLRALNELNQEELSSKEILDYTKESLRLVKKCLNKEVNNFYGVTYTKKAK